MNFLHQLMPTVWQKGKRRGRGLGSGRGSKSGRGTTRHQRARTNIPLHFEGGQGRIVKKYPLLRGKSKNKSIVPLPYIIPLSQLERVEAAMIDIDALIKANMIPSDAATVGVKVLFDKPITKALQLNLPVSASVKEIVEKAGGKIQG